MTSSQDCQSEVSIKPDLSSAESPDKDVTSRDYNSNDTRGSPAEAQRVEDIAYPSKIEIEQQPHPFVFWSHTDSHLSIRVDLSQAERVTTIIQPQKSISPAARGERLVFDARGRGAQGLKEYHFELDLFSEVEQKHTCHVIERYVLILITKSNPNIQWKQLTKQPTKFPWLRVDFDRYADSNEDSDVDSETDSSVRDRLAYEQLRRSLDSKTEEQINHTADFKQSSWSEKLRRIWELGKVSTGSKVVKMKYDYRKEAISVDNSKNTAKHALDFKKTYLFIYNLVMFVMFLKVYIVLLIKGISGTIDDDIVEGAAFIIKILTYTQLLETLHPILGLVPGGPFMPFLQVVGRLLVNEFLRNTEVRLDSGPYVQYLFVVWSSIEIFRYSFYALRVFKVNIQLLTWCRYTLFLPLYPMGGLCEFMVVLSTIKYIEKTGAYTIDLPNPYNISFNPKLILQTHIYLLLGPSIYYLMRYMWKQRCKQLSKEKTA